MLQKAEPHARVKRRRKRYEGTVAMRVRRDCVERDGYCRLADVAILEPCHGPSEWAHLGLHKRFRTRGLSPDERHCTEGSLMLCQAHHAAYDGKRIDIQPATSRGADGPLGMACRSQVHMERER